MELKTVKSRSDRTHCCSDTNLIPSTFNLKNSLICVSQIVNNVLRFPLCQFMRRITREHLYRFDSFHKHKINFQAMGFPFFALISFIIVSEIVKSNIPAPTKNIDKNSKTITKQW
eukprot:495317_1